MIGVFYVVFYTPLFTPKPKARSGIPQASEDNILMSEVDEATPEVEEAPIVTPEAFIEEEDIQKEIKKTTRTLRDPFSVDFTFKKAEPVATDPEALPSAPAVVQEKFVLQGVFSVGSKRTAIIDERVLSVGDWIYGWKVEEIYSNRAVLKKGGKVKTLYIKLGVD